MTPSKIFLYFCLSFILGVFLNSIFSISQLTRLGFLILGLILISVFWQYKKFTVFGFCLLFLVAGIWRHQVAESEIIKSELRKYNDRNEIITLVGIIATEPDIREKITKLTVKIQSLDGNKKDGRVLVTTWRYPEYQYGDKLEIEGKLESPPILEGFNYQDYLQKEGIYSVMSWPKIKLVERGQGNPAMKILFSFKNKFRETTRTFFSLPQEGLLEALVFGDEGNISREWKEKLNITGTRHIAAVSGMNVTIIGFLVLSFISNLGFWRNQAFYISIFLLLFYILMIGAPASAVRAGIMGGLLMLAQYFGRLFSAQRAVVFAAFFMLLQNPLLLRFDIGFQLSFLAILGIIHLQPFFFKCFKFIPNSKIFPLRMVLSATIAPQIFALPILVYNFGRIPLVSPITNILIIPIIAPLTILIFIFGVLTMIALPLGSFLSWPIWLFLTYIIFLVDRFSKFSLASLTLENVHWIWILIFYLILGYLTFRLKEREKLKFLKY